MRETLYGRNAVNESLRAGRRQFFRMTLVDTVRTTDVIGDILTMAVSDPFDVVKLDDIRIIANCDIRPVIATEDRIRKAIDRIYNKRQQEMDDLRRRFEMAVEDLREQKAKAAQLEEELAKAPPGGGGNAATSATLNSGGKVSLSLIFSRF